MKAIRIHSYGGAEAMQIEDLATPNPGEGEALVRVAAAGVNFMDIYQRTGMYQVPLPSTMGVEAAGTVEALGPGTGGVAVGDRVAWANVQGAYAERAVVAADRLILLPAQVDMRAGAAAMLQGMTAHYLTHSTAPLTAGDTCLVHAAAGGVGQLLCQMLKMRGVRIIGTVSTDAKAEIAHDAGADEVVLYGQQDFEAEVKRLTDGQGVTAVYDSVGRDTFDKSLNCLRPRGYMILYGASSGAILPVDPQILAAKGSLWLTRPTLVSFTTSRAELTQRAGEVLSWIGSGALRLAIDRDYPLAQAPDAHRALANRETAGKILLIP